jgi:hypothetical protein
MLTSNFAEVATNGANPISTATATATFTLYDIYINTSTHMLPFHLFIQIDLFDFDLLAIGLLPANSETSVVCKFPVGV